ncbi:MAG: DUF4388 domain-containing protein [Acidimicrobiales bacterium]
MTTVDRLDEGVDDGADRTGEVTGSLDVTALPALLRSLADAERTGVLRIDGGPEVWLHQGRTCIAVTPASPELAKVLFDGDLGTPEAIDAALRQPPPADGSRPSGVDRLLAERPEAEPAVKLLIREVSLNTLFELLVPSRAGYRFEAGVTHPLGARFADDTRTLLAAARQRVEIWRRIAARIPSTAALFVLAPELPEAQEERLVTADEWRFLARLDGRRTVADLIAETGQSAFRVCSSLYRLLLEELIIEGT